MTALMLAKLGASCCILNFRAPVQACWWPSLLSLSSTVRAGFTFGDGRPFEEAQELSFARDSIANRASG